MLSLKIAIALFAVFISNKLEIGSLDYYLIGGSLKASTYKKREEKWLRENFFLHLPSYLRLFFC